MPLQKSPLKLCDCNRSACMDGNALGAALRGRGPVSVHHDLCRRELGEVEAALAGGDVVVGCTQESALFAELAAAAGSRVDCVNLRENAGWSDEAAHATPKLAALIAAATLPDPDPVPAVTLVAGNALLIVGEAGAALGWAERLQSRFDVSVLVTGATRGAELPIERRFAVWSGAEPRLDGHLGAFDLRWLQTNPIDLDLCVRCNACVRACPEHAIGWDYQVDAARCRGHRACVTACASVGAIDFARADTVREARFDLVLDLGAEPLLRRAELPQGYAAPGRDPLEQALAAQALGEFVGEFEKPRYVAFDAKLCAHARSRRTGCTNCLDVCATAAISAAGDVVSVDPYLCQGCGTCATVCPTGALAAQYPRAADLGLRLRTALGVYRDAGGEAPCVLFHSAEAGRTRIDALARHGRGLPARVLPLDTWSADSIGLDLLLGAVALGACQVAVLAAGTHDAAPLRAQARVAEAVLDGLGYAGEHFRIVESDDWRGLEEALWDWAPAAAPARGGTFRIAAAKRDTLDLALRHLVALAPAPVAEIALPAGAPFGALTASDACTLCMACVGVCPTGALAAATDAMRLGFVEKHCVQCGLCASACPEHALALVPRLRLDDAARRSVPLRQAEMLDCVACGKPLGAKPLVEAMFARLATHPMFGDEAGQRRLRMCGDCRVIDLMRAEDGVKAWDLAE